MLDHNCAVLYGFLIYIDRTCGVTCSLGPGVLTLSSGARFPKRYTLTQ